ncbi:major facilitator superfamily domain-containing protein [Triangularia verruculosa]|uniref:Major facilitator superfamily domain-containing protein n=1 Tax=Triangularia verruculosa TaxID=2587418 RepID=A0AAN6XA40_9PEZI|nr:major facilitator superfamily domain-containing protein [Triangularia verruculosa]
MTGSDTVSAGVTTARPSHLPSFINLPGTRQKSVQQKPPLFLKFRSSTVFIVVTVCLAIFTDILFYGLIVPVFPFSLLEQIRLAEDKVQEWTAILLACYNVTLCLGSPVVGFYADHTSSRRWPLLLGLVALCASTVLLCLAKTIALLVVGRLLQGLSAAIVWSVGLALLVDTVGKDIGYAMGYVTIAMSVGLLISPVIGGAVYDAAGYYAVFYIAFVIIACDIALRLVLVEKRVAQQWAVGPESSEGESAREEDEEKQVQAISHAAEPASLPSPTPPAGTSSGSPNGESSTPALNPAKHPHWELIKNRRVLAALLAIAIEACIVFAFDTVIPLYVKETFRWNSTAAGLIFICVMVPGFASPIVGKLADKHGAKWFSVAGFALSIPPLVCLRFVTSNTIEHKVLLCALLTLLGVTLVTLANTPLMAEITYAIDEREAQQPGIWGEKGVYGIAYGLFTTAYALGGTVGSITAGYIQAGPGWGTTTWYCGLWAAVGAVVSFWLGSRPDDMPKSLRPAEELPTSRSGVV